MNSIEEFLENHNLKKKKINHFLIFWYKLPRLQERAETSKLELKMKFLFAANCNLQQILSAFLEIENACAHNLWQVAEKFTLQLKLVATHCLL